MRLRKFLWEERSSRPDWWGERLLAVMAIAVLLAISLAGSHVRSSQDAASDFKTVYASGRCFLRGVPAYDFSSLATVFRHNHVVLPSSWYAHAPIYPPFTFVVLAPFLALPMVTAAYVWMALSALALVGCTWAIAGFSQREFGLVRGWRLLGVLLVANPLVLFGLQIGNMSVAAAALGVMAVMTADVVPPAWPAAALTLSLLLKPHLALCLVVGMYCSRRRGDRAVAGRALLFFAAALACIGVFFSFGHPLGLQLHGFIRMLADEFQTGSMNPGNHQPLPIQAEVTSMSSLFGFFGEGAWPEALSIAVLAAMAAVLVVLSRSPASRDGENRLALLGAWTAFGLTLTYHRAHDGILLLVLAPWLLARWRRRWSCPVAWSALLLLGALSLNFAELGSTLLTARPAWMELSQFLLYRQAAVATLGLELLLLGQVLRRSRSVASARKRSSLGPAVWQNSVRWGWRS